MSTVSVRYIVNDVEEAISFYTEFLDLQCKDASCTYICNA